MPQHFVSKKVFRWVDHGVKWSSRKTFPLRRNLRRQNLSILRTSSLRSKIFSRTDSLDHTRTLLREVISSCPDQGFTLLKTGCRTWMWKVCSFTSRSTPSIESSFRLIWLCRRRFTCVTIIIKSSSSLMQPCPSGGQARPEFGRASVMSVVVGALHRHGMHTLLYVDDLLIAYSSFEESSNNRGHAPRRRHSP
jgi:hypothetical protein